ncbi:MAG: hypothetical protein EHM89_17260 [Acidobacteria bacterium]|nr:MAG: hypothetical protein EHM89_17260 [Acidobacteriota bacterium]
MVLAVVVLSGCLASSLLPSVPPASPNQQASSQTGIKATEGMQVVGGIEATRDVQAVLAKMREALGGNQRLLDVKSLVVEGDRDGSFLSRRILLPDRIQSKNAGASVINTFTLDGARYSQVPERDEATMAGAKKNTIKEFVTQSIVLLVRAPSVLKVRATLPKSGRAGALIVMFTSTGGFAVQVEVDPTTYTPQAYSYIGNLTEENCDEPPVVTSATRRVTFDEYRTFAGIRFPVVMTDTITTPDGRAFPVPLRHSVIRVNEGVTEADFQK